MQTMYRFAFALTLSVVTIVYGACPPYGIVVPDSSCLNQCSTTPCEYDTKGQCNECRQIPFVGTYCGYTASPPAGYWILHQHWVNGLCIHTIEGSSDPCWSPVSGEVSDWYCEDGQPDGDGWFSYCEYMMSFPCP